MANMAVPPTTLVYILNDDQSQLRDQLFLHNQRRCNCLGQANNVRVDHKCGGDEARFCHHLCREAHRRLGDSFTAPHA